MFALILALQVITFEPQPDIYLEVHGSISQEAPWSFFAPHENENLVNQYVSDKVVDEGGIYVILKQNSLRGIELKFGDEHIVVDPNRIFTKKGIRETIKKSNLNKKVSNELMALATARALALGQFIVEHLGGHDTSRTWIATHNNTQGYTGDSKNGFGTISIERYEKKLAEGASFLAGVYNAGKDEDDLFFVTDKHYFSAMKSAGFNAVLQHPQVAWLEDENDGSLSVYAEMKGIRYINVEAERHDPFRGAGENHVEEQIEMVDFTFALLSPQPKNADRHR